MLSVILSENFKTLIPKLAICFQKIDFKKEFLKFKKSLIIFCKIFKNLEKYEIIYK